ncbi:uncharacterized protein LOC127755016 isoform X2 [Oryza glaberrima]|uniref:uncharacterized protein LOC127755016 isoform X2 n=1 Tax=Oryza glaberrima TaxID=4538 RepID=UPI00224C0211|nr:uncharacterized protein LOC127755016 isoform X2 [Oryza glaberrima]
MAGAAASPSRCKTMVAPSPFTRPLAAGWWKRHLIPRPRPLAAGSCRDWFVTSATWRPDDLLPRILLLPRKERKKGVQARMLDYSVLKFKHHRPACYDGPLDAMAACVVHAGGSDGGIQAHIKACAALGAICSSVVTAHNTIVVQGVSVTLKPWLPERIKATGDTSKLCAIMQRSAIDEKRFN